MNGCNLYSSISERSLAKQFFLNSPEYPFSLILFKCNPVLCSIRFLYLHITIPSSGYHYTVICIANRYRDVGEMIWKCR